MKKKRGVNEAASHTQYFGIKKALCPIKQFSEGDDIWRVKSRVRAWIPTRGDEGCLDKFTKKTKLQRDSSCPKEPTLFSFFPQCLVFCFIRYSVIHLDRLSNRVGWVML